MSVAKVCPRCTSSSSQPPPGPLELQKGYFLHKEFHGLGGAGAKAQTTKVSGVPGSLPLGPRPAPLALLRLYFMLNWKLGQGPANAWLSRVSHLDPGVPEPFNEPSRS